MWRDVKEAQWYYLEVSLEVDFATKVVSDSALSDTNVVLSPLADGMYYWRVRAGDRVNWSAFSEVWSFVLDTTPPSVVWTRYSG